MKPWSRNEWSALGKVSDDRIARRTGRTVEEVRAERERLEQFASMPKWGPAREKKSCPPRLWTLAECAAVASLPPADAAKRIDRKLYSIFRMRKWLGLDGPPETVWTAEKLGLLGTMPDTELARKLGITLAPVRAMRMRLRIKGYVRVPPWRPEAVAIRSRVRRNVSECSQQGVKAA